MTDQTRWGIDLVHTKNKAIKRQKDILSRSLAEVDKLEEQYIVELMMEIEAITFLLFLGMTCFYHCDTYMSKNFFIALKIKKS